MQTALQTGRIGESHLSAEYRVYQRESFGEMRFRVHWQERHKLLKLTFAVPSPIARRVDGILGGELERSLDAKEYPLRDRTLLRLADGNHVGIVCPDVYAMDATPRRVRLT